MFDFIDKLIGNDSSQDIQPLSEIKKLVSNYTNLIINTINELMTGKRIAKDTIVKLLRIIEFDYSGKL